MVNYNELFIPINFNKIFEEHGVRKGTISYSPTFKSWVIVGHPTIDMICIDPPYKEGDIYNSKSIYKAHRFIGMTVSRLYIRCNMWCLSFDEYWNN